MKDHRVREISSYEKQNQCNCGSTDHRGSNANLLFLWFHSRLMSISNHGTETHWQAFDETIIVAMKFCFQYGSSIELWNINSWRFHCTTRQRDMEDRVMESRLYWLKFQVQGNYNVTDRSLSLHCSNSDVCCFPGNIPPPESLITVTLNFDD